MKRVLTAFLALAVFQLLGGCGDNDANNGIGPGGPGVLVVRMTDGPGAYDAVNIVVDSLRVHFGSDDTLAGWYTISRGRAEYNLLTYLNGRDTVIGEGSIPAGYYSQLRLYIGSGSAVVTGGSTFPLAIPSGMQSGLKLNIQANILSGVRYELALDFDAERSIVTTGNGQYALKPVIRVVTTAISGGLTGLVLPDTVQSAVWAIAGTDTSTTLTDATGYFKFKYLVPGLYFLSVVPADTTFLRKDIPNVAVAAAQTTDVGTIILQKR